MDKKPSDRLIYEKYDSDGDLTLRLDSPSYREDRSYVKNFLSDLYFFLHQCLPGAHGIVDQYIFLPGDEHVKMILDTSSSVSDELAETALERCLTKLPKAKVLKILKKNGYLKGEK